MKNAPDIANTTSGVYLFEPPYVLKSQGVNLGKFNGQYMAKVNVPCKKCNSLVKAGINEKIMTCPVCNSKWN